MNIPATLTTLRSTLPVPAVHQEKNNDKKLAFATQVIAAFATAPIALADNVCAPISGSNSGSLEVTDCMNIVPALAKSGQFPSIFSSRPVQLLGLCYTSSADGIQAKIGNREIVVKAATAFTNTFLPSLLGGEDNLGNVIGKWTITDVQSDSVVGSLFTMDTIDMTSGIELDVILDGTGRLAGARGSVKIKSYPSGPNSVAIAEISGTLCVPK